MSSANFLFLSLILSGTGISLSSSNWLIVWAGMELSFLGLIPILFTGSKYMSMNKESSIKYFCIQALGSAMIFLSGLFSFSNVSGFLYFLLFFLGIWIKIGAFPIHSWVPNVISGLNFSSIALILTIQKVPAFALLNLMILDHGGEMKMVMSILGCLSSLVGSIMGNNQTDLLGMLGYSSVAHTGWMILGCVSGNFWLYFSVYCISFLYFSYLMVFSRNFSVLSLSLLSLSGLPPFIMFLGKWSLLVSCFDIGMSYWVLGAYLASAVISLFFYLKFSYIFMLISGYTWTNTEIKNCIIFLMFNFLGLLIFYIV